MNKIIFYIYVNLSVVLPHLTVVMASFSVNLLALAAVIKFFYKSSVTGIDSKA
jgi:hypothetical protein